MNDSTDGWLWSESDPVYDGRQPRFSNAVAALSDRRVYSDRKRGGASPYNLNFVTAPP